MPRFIDLSQEIYQGQPVFPGHLPTCIWDYHTHDRTRGLVTDNDLSYATRGLLLNDHGPTHVDSISHFNPSPDAPTIDKMDANLFWGPALCVDVSGTPAREDILVADVERSLDEYGLSVEPGDTLLFHTGHPERNGGTPAYLSEYPGLAMEVAEWMVARGVKILGIDSPSPDNPASRIYPVHLVGRRESMTHYEHLANLGAVVGKRFTFFGVPLKIRDGHGSPVRAFALVDDED